MSSHHMEPEMSSLIIDVFLAIDMPVIRCVIKGFDTMSRVYWKIISVL